MTFMIILGAAAAIYLALLMMRLASIALPLYAGIGAALFLAGHGFGYPASIAAGLLAGATIHVAGRMVFATMPPLFRPVVAMVFVIPAAFAGYQAVRGLAGLALTQGALLESTGAAGALVAGLAAWRRLGTRLDDPSDAGPAGATS